MSQDNCQNFGQTKFLPIHFDPIDRDYYHKSGQVALLLLEQRLPGNLTHKEILSCLRLIGIQ